MDSLVQDLRSAARMFLRRPGLAALLVVTLALGIGANTAVFSAVYGVLLRPLPFQDPERLVFVWGRHAESGNEPVQVSYGDFADIRRQADAFDGAAALFVHAFTVTGEGGSDRVPGLRASPELFPLLGVEAALGRTFAPDEERAGNDRVALLSHRFWQRRFGADPGVVGRAITLDGASHTIVGVLPPDFELEFPLSPSFSVGATEVWAPLTDAHDLASSRKIYTYEVIAKLGPGVDLDAARAQLAAIGSRLEAAYPDSNRGRSFDLVPMHEQVVGDTRPALLVLLAAVALVLLVACANIASLLLGSVASRRREIAVRAALGAGRLRIVRQLTTESLLLAAAGGLVGLVLASWAIDLLVALPGVELPRTSDVRIDLPVLGFALAVSVATGLVTGVAPAAVASRFDLRSALKQARGGREQRTLRSLLTVSEVALASMLLVGALLLASSFVALVGVDPGLESSGVLTFKVTPPHELYPERQQIVDFYRRLAPGLEALPSVERAGLVSSLPLSGHNAGSSIRIENRPSDDGEPAPSVGWQVVSPGYFAAMRIPLLGGRGFEEADLAAERHVTVVDETLARRYFPDEDPVGKRILLGAPGAEPDWHEIVGVVGAVRHSSLDAEPQPRAYDLLGQHAARTLTAVLRTSGDPGTLAEAARRRVAELDPSAPVFAVSTLDDLIAKSAAPRRFSASLVTGFALVALLLAAVGVYGNIAASVDERMREIGIRAALGEKRSAVVRRVVGRGLRLTAAGLALGVGGALGLSRALAGMLFGVSATDPAVYFGVVSLLMITAVLASAIPALRAAKADPASLLRVE